MSTRPIFEKQFNQLLDGQINDDNLCWWYDSRPTGGFRLSLAAWNLLSQSPIDRYEFDVEQSCLRRPRFLLDLDRKLPCPYYVNFKKHCRVIMFDSREAMMATLYGDVEKFLQSHQSRPITSQ